MARQPSQEAVPRDGQAGRLGLQSRLRVLLLPEQADAAGRPGRRSHGRRGAGALRAGLHRECDGRGSGLFVAGRRAHAARPRLLSEGRGAATEIRQDRPADRERPADQRHAARRGVGAVPEGAPLPRGPFHRRSEGNPRQVPRHQARRADVRYRVRGGEDAQAVRCALQHADLREPLQRVAAARRLSFPPPRAGLDLSPVHPDRRDQGVRDRGAADVGPRADAYRRHAAGETGPPGLGGDAVVRRSGRIRVFPFARCGTNGSPATTARCW